MKDNHSAARAVLALTFAFGLCTQLCAQSTKRLTIGDPAPALKVEAWVKGAPFKIEKGKVYVVEFWATWCGPCIQAMPHLSDLADKMKGKAEFVSVNVLDRSPGTEFKPGSKTHVDRITKWVNENSDKLRYSVVLDDATNTMAKTWLTAAGQGGIPCAFIVDQEGTLAWIGHPAMGLDKAVMQVTEGKFDKKAYKKEYEAYMKPQFDELAKKQALIKVANSGDLNAIEKAYKASIASAQHPNPQLLTTILDPLSKAHPETAVAFLRKRANTDSKDDVNMIGGSAVFMAPRMQGNKKAAKALVEVSLKNANRAKPGTQAIIFAYHARVLFHTGDKAGANQWIAKAASKLSIYEPALYRDNIRKYIDDTREKFKNADGQ